MQANIQATQRSGGLSYKWLLTIVVILGAFMSVMDSTIVNIALPRLETAFGANVNSVQWVLTGYTLAQGVATPLAAYLTDRFGIKRFYIFSLAAFTIGSALCGLSVGLPMLIIFRIVQGLGGAALMPLSLTLLYSAFPPEERGAAMGVFGVPVLLAPALGPTFGGYLVTFSGWQLIFYINVPIGIVAILLAMLFIRAERVEKRPTFDLLGFIFVAIGLAAGLYGLSSASSDGWTSGTVVSCLTVGVLFLAIFVYIELSRSKHGKQPLLNLRLYGNGPFLTSNIATILMTFGMFGGLFLLPIYMQNMRGLNAYQAGLELFPQALASMVATIITGRLVDRLGVKGVVIPGLILMGISTWYMTSLDSHTPWAWFQFLLILRGLALGTVIQPLSVSMVVDIKPRELAQATSVSTVGRSVATSLGVAILSTIVATQQNLHYGHLAELVTPFSRLGGMIYGIQARFVAQGASAVVAHSAALQEISGMLHGQAFIMSLQDAFRVTMITVVASIIAVLLIRTKRKDVDVPMTAEEIEEIKKARAEMMAG